MKSRIFFSEPGAVVWLGQIFICCHTFYTLCSFPCSTNTITHAVGWSTFFFIRECTVVSAGTKGTCRECLKSEMRWNFGFQQGVHASLLALVWTQKAVFAWDKSPTVGRRQVFSGILNFVGFGYQDGLNPVCWNNKCDWSWASNLLWHVITWNPWASKYLWKLCTYFVGVNIIHLLW